jgi:dihydrofolate synthase/folylpolyglutamate synthase
MATSLTGLQPKWLPKSGKSSNRCAPTSLNSADFRSAAGRVAEETDSQADPGPFDPEAYLNSLEPIGWKLGLGRMDLLSSELGRPQDSFGSIHVVGTNGKSSVARMSAAVLTAHGLRAGCLVSPHFSRWSERVLVDGSPLPEDAFTGAVERTARAAAAVDARLERGESITQFEISVAAGFLALADAGVEVAAVEAGLGGRLDATNSIDSSLTVLTTVGLDHTDWLGDTELEIAGEKLAVLRPGTILVLGPVSPEVHQLAVSTAAERRCRVVEPGESLPGGIEPDSPALYQRTNFALAIAAAGEFLGIERPGVSLETDRLRAAAAAAAVPGRLEKLGERPPVYLDVAHNQPGAAALAASVPSLAGGRPVVGVLGLLDDKDAEGILAELAPVLDHAVMTRLPDQALANSARPGARGWDPGRLSDIALAIGLATEAFTDPGQALSRATELALELDGVVLIAGSHYLRPRRP